MPWHTRHAAKVGSPEASQSTHRHLMAAQETKTVFEKLHKYIGKNIKHLVERSDEDYVLRLHKNRIYYVREALMRRSTNVRLPSLNVQHLGAAVAAVSLSLDRRCRCVVRKPFIAGVQR